MKQVNLYVRGICINTGESGELRKGKYIALLEYQNKHKKVFGTEINTTSNRMFLKAVIEGLSLLKECCIVNIYTPTRLGFNSKSSPNKDLINQILGTVKSNGHMYKEVQSKEYQDYLNEELKKLD